MSFNSWQFYFQCLLIWKKHLVCIKKNNSTLKNGTFSGGADVGVNPKINNMQPGYLASKYPLVLISDSGIKSEYFLRFIF